MKQFIQAFLAFFCILFVLNVSYAQTSTNATCVPVNMVNPSTVVPCGNGYTGSKFKRTVVTCPGNQSTQTDYDTSQCVALSNYNPPSKCSISPELCSGTPTPAGCQSGKHWTLTGMSYAHCVDNDYSCSWGTTLQHDSTGEPTGCKQNTCPSNQVLQGDGVSCACPASLPLWNGTSCAAPVCLSHTGSVYNGTCPAGQTGQISLQDTIDCNNNVLSTATISNTCAAIVTCPAASTIYTSCPSGQYGQVAVTTSYSTVNNTCVSNTSTNSSGCVPAVQCPSTSQVASACPAGQSGNIITTTSYSSVNNSCVPSTITNSSACHNIVLCPDGSVMPANGICPSAPPPAPTKRILYCGYSAPSGYTNVPFGYSETQDPNTDYRVYGTCAPTWDYPWGDNTIFCDQMACGGS